MHTILTSIRRAAALSLVVFAAACAGDADTGDAEADTNAEGGSILPPGDPTGGAGDMGTGTGTTGPGTATPDTGVGMDTASAAGGTTP